ncbi:hypothetical protein ACFYWD_15270 [Streptomyces sp. NPDC003781]|uniref:hypothetical protein n=1 Tax=Streptomyces sp. NPDC003781 TaxID=3364686 RepID=UPI0036BCDD9D
MRAAIWSGPTPPWQGLRGHRVDEFPDRDVPRRPLAERCHRCQVQEDARRARRLGATAAPSSDAPAHGPEGRAVQPRHP